MRNSPLCGMHPYAHLACAGGCDMGDTHITRDGITRDDVLRWIQTYAQVITDNRAYLTELDAAIGDADHGANMDRGFKAVLAKLPMSSDKDIAAVLKAVGMTLLSTVGGAGGPLYGTF